MVHSTNAHLSSSLSNGYDCTYISHTSYIPCYSPVRADIWGVSDSFESHAPSASSHALCEHPRCRPAEINVQRYVHLPYLVHTPYLIYLTSPAHYCRYARRQRLIRLARLVRIERSALQAPKSPPRRVMCTLVSTYPLKSHISHYSPIWAGMRGVRGSFDSHASSASNDSLQVYWRFLLAEESVDPYVHSVS